MKIEMSRTIQTAPYETLRYSIEFAEEDFAKELERFDTPTRRANALHILVYNNVLQFQVLHGKMTTDERDAELARVKAVLLPSLAGNNGNGNGNH